MGSDGDRTAGGTARPRGASPVAWRPLVAVAAVRLAVWAVAGGRYGFHRDETYYLIGGRHLELGYVDHPFLVPWLARAAESLFGLWLPGLRLLPALAGAVIVLVAGVLTARLGGGRWAQLLAAAATLVCPFHLMAQNLFQTVPFDQLWWALALLVLAHRLDRSDPRWWLAFGFVAGLGLVTKYTILALGAGVVVGILLTPWRRELVRPWIYAGGALALLIAAPNLLWQAGRGWPTLEFMANNHAAETFQPPAFLSLQAVFLGPFSLPLAVAGLLFLFGGAQRRFRPLGWAVAFVFLLFLATSSKPYYAAPTYPLLFAAGAVLFERRFGVGSGLRRAAPFLLLLGNLAAVPIFLPILPERAYARLHDGFPHKEFGEMFGWPELVQATGEAYRDLPPELRAEVAVVTSSYGSAAAIDLWGGAWDLPPASCGQNSYHYWSKPDSLDPVLAVAFRPEWLEELYREIEPLGVVENRLGIANQEASRGIYLVRGARLPRDEIWERLRFFR